MTRANHLWDPWHSHLLPSVWYWKCHVFNMCYIKHMLNIYLTRVINILHMYKSTYVKHVLNIFNMCGYCSCVVWIVYIGLRLCAFILYLFCLFHFFRSLRNREEKTRKDRLCPLMAVSRDKKSCCIILLRQLSAGKHLFPRPVGSRYIFVNYAHIWYCMLPYFINSAYTCLCMWIVYPS